MPGNLWIGKPVGGALTIATASALPNATQHSFYRQVLSATGGTPPYTWTVDDDGQAVQIDPSLQIETGSGVLSGIPELPGSYSFTLVCTDSVGNAATKAMTHTVASSGALTIQTPADLTPYYLHYDSYGTPANKGYAEQLFATGGQPPYTWSLVSGPLPGVGNGTLKFSQTGSLCAPTGSPYYTQFNGTPGLYPITVRCTDSVGANVTQLLNLWVDDNLSAGKAVADRLNFTLFGNPLLSALQGAAFTYSIGAEGGTAPYTWSVVNAQGLNTLADLSAVGLTLNTSTGVITGTPTAETFLRLFVRVTDNVGNTVSQLFHVQVKPNTNIWAGSVVASKPFRPMKTTFALPGGTVRNVNSSATLTAALAAASLGDIIVMAVTSTDSGGKYTGPFTLPTKSGSSWIYIVSANYYNNTPSSGTTIPQPGTMPNNTTDLVNMPWVTTAAININPFATSGASHHYRFVGIHMTPGDGITTYGLLVVQNPGINNYNQIPHHFILDRCCLEGDDTVTSGGTVHLAITECAYFAAVDTWMAKGISTYQDAQAIQGLNVPGPIKVDNCMLSAAGENLMFGGGDATIYGVLASDVTLTNIQFYKPEKWMFDDGWTVKNLLEFKHGRRVHVKGNRFNGLWNTYNSLNQRGLALLFRGANQDGGGTWNSTRDLTFEYNYMDSIAAALNMVSQDGRGASTSGGSWNQARITIRHNVFDTGRNVGTQGPNYIQLGAGLADFIFDHNTYLTKASQPPYSSAVIWYASPPQNTTPGTGGGGSNGLGPCIRFAWTNNIHESGASGFAGDGLGVPNLTTYLNANMGTGSWTFDNNVSILTEGALNAGYPSGNFFPATEAAVQFTSLATGNYQLAGGSPYKGQGKNYAGLYSAASAPSDGLDLGADYTKLKLTPLYAFQITTASLPNGAVGTAYSQPVLNVGGYWPYVYAISAGALPPGLVKPTDSPTVPVPAGTVGPRFSPYPGSITGTPTTPGTYNFTVAITDAHGVVVQKALSITVV